MAQGDAINPRADRLAQAQAAIEAMKDGYKAQLQQDMAELSQIWALVDQAAPDIHHMDKIFEVAHNLKGQAGTFGYELVTSVAASLCDVLREDRANPSKTKVVGQHVGVLKRIVEKNVVGHGGETGARVIEALQALSARG